jgi:hypothetical protein
VKAGLCVAVVDGGSAPAILGAALVGSALGVSILGSAVTSKGNRHKGQEGESGEAHYDYD